LTSIRWRWEGTTENATLVTELLVDLRERGLDVTRPMLVGLDGSKALRKAVVNVLDHPVIQRCQLHKIRNVKDDLPQRLRSSASRRMTDAYHASSALEAVNGQLRRRCWRWQETLTAPTPARRQRQTLA
jgi:transposase-like protein